MVDAEEGSPAGPSPRIKVRIESLSDLVFGLALSIGSLILVGNVPTSGQAIGNNVVLFGFGFLILVIAWLGYSRTMAVLPVELPFALVMNIALLFLVALEPYLYYVLQNVHVPGLADASSVAYALDLGGMFLMQGALAYLVVREEKTSTHGQPPLHPAVVARFRNVMKVDLLIGLVFAVSALPVFWVDTPVGFLRFYLWGAPFFIASVGFRRRRHPGQQG